jgi:hypothetical protein
LDTETLPFQDVSDSSYNCTFNAGPHPRKILKLEMPCCGVHVGPENLLANISQLKSVLVNAIHAIRHLRQEVISDSTNSHEKKARYRQKFGISGHFHSIA